MGATQICGRPVERLLTVDFRPVLLSLFVIPARPIPFCNWWFQPAIPLLAVSAHVPCHVRLTKKIREKTHKQNNKHNSKMNCKIKK
jgi:hypothetical protein